METWSRQKCDGLNVSRIYSVPYPDLDTSKEQWLDDRCLQHLHSGKSILRNNKTPDIDEIPLELLKVSSMEWRPRFMNS